MYDNRRDETKYIYTDDDSQGKQLNGQNTYEITFAKDQVPPVRGFWSLTLYDQYHFFHPNPLNRYSLGTKNKTLKYDSDGSLTLLCRGHIAWQGQGKQLAARAEWPVLALYPCVLGRQGHPRRHVEAAYRHSCGAVTTI